MEYFLIVELYTIKISDSFEQEKPIEPPKTPQGDSNQHAGRLKSLEISESGAFLMKKFALMPSKNPLTTRNDLEEKTQGSEESISPRLNDSSRSVSHFIRNINKAWLSKI